MSFNARILAACMFFLIYMPMTNVRAGEVPALTQAQSGQSKTAEIERITAEELKARLDKKTPIIIIDVRATDAFLSSSGKIKGAIKVKLRRLNARLALPPLKDVPRDREVVTYCACPNEETSVRAAQILIGAGFKHVRALKGGWQAWVNASGQQQPTSKAM